MINFEDNRESKSVNFKQNSVQVIFSNTNTILLSLAEFKSSKFSQTISNSSSNHH